ncbi:MAG: endonuclease [Bacteroidetes bacterium]|nr:MAG: endonuclease [Bacteroidota bacterium]
MPEGPSIVILKELVKSFKSKKVVKVSGNTKVDVSWAEGKKIKDFKSWGKHFLICFDIQVIRIHFMLYGSYRINETKPAPPRLHLKFSQGELNFYACSVKLIEEDLNNVYDWTADVMNEKWSPAKAKKKLKEIPSTLVCDALLAQSIFAGVGNIIKNEVLYRIKVHPKSKIGKIPTIKITALVKEACNYSFDFLKWKKAYDLKKHWLAHTKKTCHRCNLPIIKEYMGKTNRRTFFCNNCQVLYK